MTARRFFITLIVILLLAAGIDLLIGVAGHSLVSSAKGGDTARHRYINREMTAPLLVFGSSRAIHHYDPRVFADSLGVRAYNCGADGSGIILAYMQLTNVLARYTPSIVIYDLYGQYDFMKEPDNSKYLLWERYFYGEGNEALDSVFHTIDKNEKWKMRSAAYRYNSRFLQLMSDNYRPCQNDIQGYRPLGDMPVDFVEPNPWPTVDFDDVKLEYIRRFAEKCKEHGVTLIVAVSPYYFSTPDEQLPAAVRGIFEAYDVKVLDHSEDGDFVGKRCYFSDTNHLNASGAEAYTRKIASEVRRISGS